MPVENSLRMPVRVTMGVAAAGTAAYGFSPFRTTPAEVLAEGYHNADERVHVDDLRLSARFHLALARRLLG